MNKFRAGLALARDILLCGSLMTVVSLMTNPHVRNKIYFEKVKFEKGMGVKEKSGYPKKEEDK